MAKDDRHKLNTNYKKYFNFYPNVLKPQLYENLLNTGK